MRVERPSGELRGHLIELGPPRGVSLRTVSGKVIQLPAEEVFSIVEL